MSHIWKTTIPRFGTPLEGYSKDLYAIKTLADVRAFEEKYYMFLDDAAPAVEGIKTENDVESFLSELYKCKAGYEDELPPDEWLDRFGAIPLPALFIRLAPVIQGTQMGSGFVMNRLLDEKMAVIEDGRFKLIVDKAKE